MLARNDGYQLRERGQQRAVNNLSDVGSISDSTADFISLTPKRRWGKIPPPLERTWGTTSLMYRLPPSPMPRLGLDQVLIR